MKKIVYIVWAIVIFSLPGCKRTLIKKELYGRQVDMENFVRERETKHLAEIYYEHGNFINSPAFPPVISPAEVYKHLNDWLIIDLRSQEAYEAGHINGAYRVDKKDVLDFLKTKEKAAAYDKVIFVCYSGQTASYVTGVTRFAGFDNTYAMLFGMAGWNEQFADPVKKGFGDRYPEMLEKGTYESGIPEGSEHELLHAKIDISKLPPLPKTSPSILLDNRAHKLLSLERPAFLLKDEEYFPALKRNLDTFYSVFYIDKAKYYVAHVKGSHQFTPRKDLSLDARLTELPVDKPVVIYCKTGHTGGHTAAYLGMMGYDAKNLIFGAAGFMYSLWKEKGWLPDVSYYIHNFPVIEGKKRFSGNAAALKPVKKKAPVKIAVPKRKKKEVTGGCG